MMIGKMGVSGVTMAIHQTILGALSLICIASLSASIAFLAQPDNWDGAPLWRDGEEPASSIIPLGSLRGESSAPQCDNKSHPRVGPDPETVTGNPPIESNQSGRPFGEHSTAGGTRALPSDEVGRAANPSGFTLARHPSEPTRYAQAESAAEPTIEGDENWDPRFVRRGVGERVRAMAWDGANLYVAGDFRTAGNVTANFIAKWDGTAWSALGTGMNGPVHALVWTGSCLYVGGQFSTAGGISANNIAKWDGSNWSALGAGIGEVSPWGPSGCVNALLWNGTNLFAGGRFTIAGGVATNGIAKWDGTAWSALAAGIYSGKAVYALAWDGTSIYAGGDFWIMGSAVANNIAKWNGSTWSALGSGMRNNGWADGWNGAHVVALAWDGTNLYAGGRFKIAGGASANRIAKWNGTAWSALGLGVHGYIHALAWDGTCLSAGGWFTSAGGVTADNMAKWEGSTWIPFGQGVNGSVDALALNGPDIYAGGDFAVAGGVNASHVARWWGRMVFHACFRCRGERHRHGLCPGRKQPICGRVFYSRKWGRRRQSRPMGRSRLAPAGIGNERCRPSACRWGGQSICRRVLHFRWMGKRQLHRQVGWEYLECLWIGIEWASSFPRMGWNQSIRRR